jgi:hypothetical protein
MTHLDTLRAIVAHAGTDLDLARLLQAARDLDREATNHPPGSMLTGTGAPASWFEFTLAIGDEGADLDTVRASLGLFDGWVLHVAPAHGDALDLVFTSLEQDDDPAANWPVFLVGNRYDDAPSANEDNRGEPVRVALAGARLTIY